MSKRGLAGAGASAKGPRGFTLVEVMVALAVGALVALLAHRTLWAAADLGARLAAAREVHDRAMNARRFLALAFGSLDVGTGPSGGFDGDVDGVRFATWLPSVRGAPERCVVSVRLADSALVALAGTDTLHLVPGAGAVAFDYLLDFGADATWVQGWSSPASAPLAVRIRIGRRGREAKLDTLLFLIGPRG